MMRSLVKKLPKPLVALIGKAVQSTASIAGALEAFLYEMNQKSDLEKAWMTYKLALTRPENRKLALRNDGPGVDTFINYEDG